MHTYLLRSFIITLFMIIPIRISAENLPPSRLVIAPTSGSLPARTYIFDTQLFDGGGVVYMFNIGIADLVNIGISYGGARIIGSSPVIWQPHVGARFRIRVLEESLKSPAVSLGFDSQGDGPYLTGEGLNRFRIKSRGVYIVMSRNYRFLGDLGFHGGVNYSLETDDNDRDPSFWVGFDKSIIKRLEMCFEYDFATNDNENRNDSSRRGYLNAAVKWKFGEAFVLEFNLKNILRDAQYDGTGYLVDEPEPSREIRLYYLGRF